MIAEQIRYTYMLRMHALKNKWTIITLLLLNKIDISHTGSRVNFISKPIWYTQKLGNKPFLKILIIKNIFFLFCLQSNTSREPRK